MKYNCMQLPWSHLLHLTIHLQFQQNCGFWRSVCKIFAGLRRGKYPFVRLPHRQLFLGRLIITNNPEIDNRKERKRTLLRCFIYMDFMDRFRRNHNGLNMKNCWYLHIYICDRAKRCPVFKVPFVQVFSAETWFWDKFFM